jgi:hypothetical protein
MIKRPALLGSALLLAVCSAACESSEPGDASANSQAQRGDASQVSSPDASQGSSADASQGSNADASQVSSTDASQVSNADAEAGADASGGRGRDSGAAADARVDASCPPTCFRAYTCAASCSAPAFDNGCCPCPAGTIDTIGCDSGQGGCGKGAPGCGEEGAACCDPAPCDGPNFCHGALRCCGATCAASCDDAGGGYCTVPCTGAKPSDSVVQACNAITSARACQDHREDEFPFGCRWVTPATAPCPPLP